MKVLMRKLEGLACTAKFRMLRFVKDETGDTNFISLAIILIIVIGFAIVFITLGDEIMTAVQTQWTTLKGKLGI